MKIVGGRDYYDSVLAYGHEDIPVFVRHKSKSLPIQTFPHSHYTPPTRSCDFHNKGAYPHNFPSLDTVEILFCGKNYLGISVTVPGEKKWDHSAQIWFVESTRRVCWSYEEFKKTLAQCGFLLKPYDDNKCREYFASAQKEDCRNAMLQNRVTIAIRCHQGSTDYWEIDGFNLKEYQFPRVKNPFEAYQEIDMWLGNLAEANPNIVKITDPEILLAKRGFDKWSFRKEPSK